MRTVRSRPDWLGVLLTITSLAAGTRATDNDGAITSSCCWPLQFQSRIGRFSGTPTGGSPGVYEEELLFSFDYAFKRWGFWVREKYVTNDYVELIYAEDHETRLATVASVKGCYRLPLPSGSEMKLPCLPENAKFVETGWLGSNRTLPYDVWQWDVDEKDFISGGDERVPAVVSMTISHDFCKPISEISWWTANNFNYTANIGFLTIHYGEKKAEDPFDDLRRFYDCKDVNELPADFDIRWDVHADQIHLINRARTPPTDKSSSSSITF